MCCLKLNLKLHLLCRRGIRIQCEEGNKMFHIFYVDIFLSHTLSFFCNRFFLFMPLLGLFFPGYVLVLKPTKFFKPVCFFTMSTGWFSLQWFFRQAIAKHIPNLLWENNFFVLNVNLSKHFYIPTKEALMLN